MTRKLPLALEQGTLKADSPCEHRTVLKDGRIICRKIAQGENAVSPVLCRTCPFRVVNCNHLRFSLLHNSSSPLLVRFNGHSELWNDEPPEVRFRQAACSVQILPIEHPNFCAGCSLRQRIHAPPEQPADWLPAAQPGKREALEIRHAYSA